MNKKIVSALLAVSMFASVSAQAATNLSDYFSGKTQYNTILNNTEVKAKVTTKVKKSTDATYTSHASTATALFSTTAGNVFDYEATLNMEPVRDFFTTYKAAATALATQETELDPTQIDNSVVKGEFVVKIAYNANLTPASPITAADINLVQGTNGIFVLDTAGSNFTANPAEVKFKVKDDTKVSELEADNKKALSDLSMVLTGFTASANDTYLTVTVTMNGQVEISDATGGTAKKYATVKFASDPTSIDNNAVVYINTRTGGGGSLGGGGSVTKAPKAYTSVDEKITEITVTNKNGVYTVDVAGIEEPTKEGYKFDGWYLDKEMTKPADNLIEIKTETYLYAKFTPIGEKNGYTVIDGVEKKIELVERDGKKYVDPGKLETPEKDGFAFAGWYFDPYFTKPVTGETEVTEDTYLYPRFINLTAPDALQSEEHNAYIVGYPDGTIKPNKDITREEVAMAFYKLLKDEYRAKYETAENDFVDVEADRWSNIAISTLANAGIIVGDTLGNFNPTKPITRAEFATIASKFAPEGATAASNIFSDIDGHWAKNAILIAVAQYWISGYEDGTFKPDANITRAEAMTIINKMLVRYADLNSNYEPMWSDVNKSDWYYGAVIEAACDNKYERNENGWEETWIDEETTDVVDENNTNETDETVSEENDEATDETLEEGTLTDETLTDETVNEDATADGTIVDELVFDEMLEPEK